MAKIRLGDIDNSLVQRGNFFLILKTDLNMPLIDGFQLKYHLSIYKELKKIKIF